MEGSDGLSRFHFCSSHVKPVAAFGVNQQATIGELWGQKAWHGGFAALNVDRHFE